MSVPVDSAELAKLFRRGFATTLALDLITKAVGAATVVVLIRGLSVSSYAYTTLLLTFAQFAGAAASGGVRTRYLREEAERVSRAGEDVPKGGFFIPLVKGILLVIFVGICAVPVAQTVGFGSKVGGSSPVILYGVGLAAGFSAVELAIAHYQAQRRFLTAGGLNIFQATALLCASLAISATGESAFSISVWFVAAMAAVALIAAGPIARQSLLALSGFTRLFSFNREEVWLALGAMPAIGAVLRVRTSQVDVVDSPANQRAMIVGWIRRAILPTGLMVGIASLLAPVVIPAIDSGRYPGSIEAFQIFLVIAFSAYLTAPAANVLMAQRGYSVIAFIYAVGLLVNLAGDVAVARRFGVTGIAIVSSTVYVAIGLALLIRCLGYASSRNG